MEEKAIALEPVLSLEQGKISDYLELTKFRLLSLVLITTIIGFYLASVQSFDVLLLFHVLLGVGFVGAGANALNQWYEQVPDARMRRTKNRPIPSGRISSERALWFGCVISAVGIAYLIVTVNLITAILGLMTWGSYLFVYTPLKQQTILNTWVGAIPGALPPVMGWTAVQNSLDWNVLPLFAILYFWQLPHFFCHCVDVS